MQFVKTPAFLLCLYLCYTHGGSLILDNFVVVPSIALTDLSCVSLQLVSLQEAKLLLKEDDELIKEVFDYWSHKRKVFKGICLISNVKQERRDGSSTSDPYVAFRRRTEKMQTRKVGICKNLIKIFIIGGQNRRRIIIYLKRQKGCFNSLCDWGHCS